MCHHYESDAEWKAFVEKEPTADEEDETTPELDADDGRETPAPTADD